MIIAKKTDDNGLDVTLDGNVNDLITEFCCIVQNFVEAGVMDKENYDYCWKLVDNVINLKRKEDKND